MLHMTQKSISPHFLNKKFLAIAEFKKYVQTLYPSMVFIEKYSFWRFNLSRIKNTSPKRGVLVLILELVTLQLQFQLFQKHLLQLQLL